MHNRGFSLTTLNSYHPDSRLHLSNVILRDSDFLIQSSLSLPNNVLGALIYLFFFFFLFPVPFPFFFFRSPYLPSPIPFFSLPYSSGDYKTQGSLPVSPTLKKIYIVSQIVGSGLKLMILL